MRLKTNQSEQKEEVFIGRRQGVCLKEKEWGLKIFSDLVHHHMIAMFEDGERLRSKKAAILAQGDEELMSDQQISRVIAQPRQKLCLL